MADTVGTILDPATGVPATLPTTLLSNDEAVLLRTYKKFLERHGIREAVYCNACWSREQADGMKAFVTGDEILFGCRCRMLFYKGVTY